jgi:hypothetical protein
LFEFGFDLHSPSTHNDNIVTTLVVVFFLYTFGSRPLFPSSLFLLGDKLKMKRDERHLPVDAFGKANNGHKLYSDWYGKNIDPIV